MGFEKRKKRAEQKVQEGIYFKTPVEAARAWSNTTGPRTVKNGREHAGMILSKVIRDPVSREKHRYYYSSKTFVGTEDSVFWQFIFLYLTLLFRWIIGVRGEAFMHTHPSGSRFGVSNADRFLLYLPQIRQSFIYDIDTSRMIEDARTQEVTWSEAWSGMLKNPRGTPR